MINANIFNIDFGRLVQWNVATFLRTTVRMKWLRVLIKPVEQIYDAFLDFRNEQLYIMSHNSQIVYLRKVLNDKFDNTDRRIVIENVEVYEPIWYYDTAENKPVYHYDTADGAPVYHYDQADYNQNNTDFVVKLPNAIKPGTPEAVTELERQVRYYVDYYKLYSKEYKLVWY